MPLAYRLMYAIGFLPWETGEVSTELRGLVEGPQALPPQRALDIGCGTGLHAVYLADHGWEVTALDALERPLRRARARAADSGATVEWIKADVADLGQMDLSAEFTLVFDRGCYHGLSDRERDTYAAAVTELTAHRATLLMMAFAPNRVPVGPSGADAADITSRFGEWELAAQEPDSGQAPGGPLRDVPRTWYRLTRR
jgi:SAM-dependent methyltransferase